MKAYAENSFENKTVVQYIHSLVNEEHVRLTTHDKAVLTRILGYLIGDAGSNIYPIKFVPTGTKRPEISNFNVRTRVGRHYALERMEYLLKRAKLDYREFAGIECSESRRTQSVYERYRFLYNFIRYGKNVIILGTDY